MNVHEWNAMLGYGTEDRLSNVQSNEELQEIVNRYNAFQKLQNYQKAHNDVTDKLNETLKGFTNDDELKLIARVDHQTPLQVDDKSIHNYLTFLQELTVFYKQQAWPEAWPEDPRALYPLLTAVTMVNTQNAKPEASIQLLTKVYCDTFGVENFLQYCNDRGPFISGMLTGVLMHYQLEQQNIEPVYKKLAEIAKQHTPKTMLTEAVKYLYDTFEQKLLVAEMSV